MLRYLDLYKDFALQYLKSLMQSKANFFIGFAGFFLMQMSGILFLSMVFSQIPTLNGWTFYEILFIYGFSQLPRGIDHLFADYLWVFSGNSIIRGDFDRYLLRPINPLFHVLSERLQLDAIGEIVIGSIIVVYSLINLNLQITFIGLILFIITVLAGAIIYTSIKLFFTALAFWIKDSFPLLNIVYMLSDFSKYPNAIYSKGIQVLLSFIIPFSFTAFIPASYFLRKSSLIYSIIGTIIVAFVTFIIAYKTWLQGIKVYESAGN